MSLGTTSLRAADVCSRQMLFKLCSRVSHLGPWSQQQEPLKVAA